MPTFVVEIGSLDILSAQLHNISVIQTFEMNEKAWLRRRGFGVDHWQGEVSMAERAQEKKVVYAESASA